MFSFIAFFFSRTTSNLPEEMQLDVEEASVCSEDGFEAASLPTSIPSMSSVQASSTSTPAKSFTATPKKRANSSEVDQSIMNYLNKAQKTEDDIDHFFNSMAYTVRQLPPIKRAEVKLQIHQIVHGAELEALFQTLQPQQK